MSFLHDTSRRLRRSPLIGILIGATRIPAMVEFVRWVWDLS